VENNKIQWHPGFCGAAELEFRKNKDILKFEAEHKLSKQPLSIDLLIVKKQKDVVLENELGHIFRKYNILEYKSPGDDMNIDDYAKTISYAGLYKSLGKKVDAIPFKEVSVSMFRETYPEKMVKQLRENGLTVEKAYPGIYYVTGNPLYATQIVALNQLDEENHSSLRVLSKRVKEDDVRRFLTESEKLKEPGDRENIDAVLHVSMAANKAIYEKIKEDAKMCEELRVLMKEEIKNEIEDAQAKGREEGREQGRAFEIIRMSIKYNANKDEIITELVEELKMSKKQAEQYLKQYEQ
jgi:hypothetical protein